jgi:hypothetical protein
MAVAICWRSAELRFRGFSEVMIMHANEHTDAESAGVVDRKKSWAKRTSLAAAIVVGVWLLIAYGLAPFAWDQYEHRHPALDDLPGLTTTGDDHPGDPVNVTLIGSEDDLKSSMQAAGWFAADPLGLESDLKIAADTVLEKAYDEAPVSNLFLYGRKEDYAFEQPVGGDPRKRHHVRFWRSDKVDNQSRPAWSGSATYDERVGLSHTTGQITHHISGDVDAERDHLFENLKQSGALMKTEVIDGFHQVRQGRNGGGDAWQTDGRLFVGELVLR